MKRQIRDFAFELRSVDGDGSRWEGYANCFNTVDWYRTVMCPGAFDLEAFRKNGFIAGLNHDWDHPIGKPGECRTDANGLYVLGEVSVDTEHANEVRQLLKARIVKGMSIAFTIKDSDWLDKYEKVESYWSEVGYTPTEQDKERAERGVLLMRKVDLFEFSPTVLPATPGSDILRVNSQPASDALDMDTETARVLATVRDWTTRLNAIAETRRAEGRTLGNRRRADMAELRDLLDSMLTASESKLDPERLALLRSLRLDSVRADALAAEI